MSAIRLTCSSCQASLKLAKALPAGKAVRCPKCGKPVRAPAEDEDEADEDTEEAPARKPAPRPAPKATRDRPKPAPAPVEDDEEEDREEEEEQEEAPRARKPAPKAAAPKGARPRPKPAPVEDDEEEDQDEEEEQEEAPRSRKAKPKAKKAREKRVSPVMLWGGIGGGVALVGVVVLVVVLVRSSPSTGPSSGPSAKKDDGANKQPQSPQPPQNDERIVIELSEGEIYFDDVSIQGQTYPGLVWKVKYRFTKGGPKPGVPYAFAGDPPIEERPDGLRRISIPEVKVNGDALKSEGTITGQADLHLSDTVPRNWVFQVNETDPRSGGFHLASNELKVTFQPRALGEKQEVLAVTAEQLLQEYAADKEATAKKYRGKVLAVEGVIAHIARPQNVNIPFVLLVSPALAAQGKSDPCVTARMERAGVDQAKSLTQGQRVTIKGRCWTHEGLGVIDATVVSGGR
jgi:hypothetical protein